VQARNTILRVRIEKMILPGGPNRGEVGMML
jgi:hypothetical protein